MSGMTTIAVEDDFLADHLDELPDDGNRYELVDGLLLVSPAPAERHQRVLSELFHLLRTAAPMGCGSTSRRSTSGCPNGCRCSPTCWS